MLRTLILGFVFLSVFQPLAVGSDFIQLRGGYFFPPQKGLYFFRPDLYVYRVNPPYFHRGYRRSPYGYGRPGYSYAPRQYSPSSAGLFPTRSVYRVVLGPPPKGEVVRVNSSDLIFSVTPAKALIYVNDKLIGSARDFSSDRDKYPVLDGEYDLRIEATGYEPFRSDLSVIPNKTLHLDIELEPKNR